MNILRRTLVGLCAFVLLISLLGLAWSHVAAATILKRDTVKNWLVEADFYNKAPEAVLQSASKNAEEQGSSDIPIDDPQIQQIAKNAFSAEYLQTNVEKVLDGTYIWLEGKSDKPDFAIDLNEAKQRLADGLGNYAVNRGAGLPACTPAQAQEMAAQGGDFDVLSASCVPPGTDVQAVAANLRNELLSNEEFLGDTSFSGDDLKVTDNGQEVTLDNAPNFKKAQTAYKVAANAPYIYAVLVLLSSLGIVFLSGSRRAGLKRASIFYIVSGVILGVSYAVFNIGNGWLSTYASEVAGESAAAQTLASAFVNAVYKDVSSLLLWYALGFTALGVGGILFARFFRRPKGKNLKQPSDPEPPIDDSPKEDPAKKPEPKTDKPDKSGKPAPTKIQL